MNDLQKHYQDNVKPKLMEQFSVKNPMALPKISKIIVNVGVKNATADKKNMEQAKEVVGLITGQKPKVTKAKKSISSFKLREGDAIGVVVTLRGKRMFTFLHKIIAVVLPRLRDFHGIKKTSFDPSGNYTFGFSEYTVFPEIDPGKFDKIQGLEVTIVTTGKDKEQGLALLTALGMPFEKK